MSSNDTYPPKLSQWSPSQVDEDEDEDDGNAPTQPLPRIRASARPIPARPQQATPKEQIAWSIPTHPLPEQHAQQQGQQQLPPPQLPLAQRHNGHNGIPSNGRMPVVPPPRESSKVYSTNSRVQIQPAAAPATAPVTVVPTIPPHAQGAINRAPTVPRRRRRLALPVAMMLVVLAVLIVFGGIFTHYLSTSGPTIQAQIRYNR